MELHKRTWVRLALSTFLVGTSSVLVGQDQETAPDPEIRRLIEQLDAEDLGQREQARDLLLRKGKIIVPVLRSFLKSPSAEVASQVRGLLERLEWEENLERSLPSRYRVTIPKKPQTLEEIFRLIEPQVGCRIVPCALPLRQKLDLGWENASVLAVIDDLCRALGRGRPELAPFKLVAPEGQDVFGRQRRPLYSDRDLVIDGEKTMPCATAHGGPLRVAVSDVVVTETTSLGSSVTRGEIHLQVSAVPGTRPIFVGPWQIEEIVDDQGRSLKPEEPARPFMGEEEVPEVGEKPDSVWFRGNRWIDFENNLEQIGFASPTPGSRKLARLRLKIRMTFPVKPVTRQLSLAEIKEKGIFDFGSGGLETTSVELKENLFRVGYRMKGALRGNPEFVLLGAEGNEIPTNGGGTSSSGNQHDQRWYLRGQEPVAAVQVKGWVGVKTLEIPVEFKDVPLPVEK